MSEKNELDFRQMLLSHRLLVSCGVPGVFGRGAVFEDVVLRLDELITGLARGDDAEVLRFPPVINRQHFERSDFLKSFPQLAGSVCSFEGDGEQHQRFLQAVHDGRDWKEFQSLTDMVLTPAACYPVYPYAAGTLPERGRLFDLFSYCFRHEPSPDPARMQSFRMREFVRMGDWEMVKIWRDAWLERGKRFLYALQLGGNAALANDPFFGRGGRMLAANQRDQQLKFELLVPICSEERPTALMSFNYHQDHFGSIFLINCANGGVAHTACVGFGMERIALALFKHHGPTPIEWPRPVQAQLWPRGYAVQ